MAVLLEKLIEQVKSLPPGQRAQLRAWLEQDAQRTAQATVPPKVFGLSPELLWLKEHGRDYIGQWIALEGNQLLAHGKDHRVVLEAAHATGAQSPLIHLVEDPDRPVWNGFF